MQKLARALIEHWWWILRCEEEMKLAFGEDYMLDHYVTVQDTMEALSPDERQAMRVEAATFLGEIMAVDEWGFSKRSQMTPERKDFFDYLITFAEPNDESAS
jgi:aminoglycoside phosphotransferase (APT) family kinase protein